MTEIILRTPGVRQTVARVIIAMCASVPAASSAQVAPAVRGSAQGVAAPQTEADAYTRYELLAPGSAKFRIVYEVTATTAGATHYFNPIRKGSVATDEHVSDRATGRPLVFDIVGQDVARAGGVRGGDSRSESTRLNSSHGGISRMPSSA